MADDSKPTGVNGIEMQNVDQGPQPGGSDDRPPAKMPTSNIDEEDDEDDDEIYMPPVINTYYCQKFSLNIEYITFRRLSRTIIIFVLYIFRKIQ